MRTRTKLKPGQKSTKEFYPVTGGDALESEEESQKSAIGPLEAAVEKEMPAYFHLKPGSKGTKQYVEKYGEALVGVRYRYDKARGLLLKTVELVIAEDSPRDPSRGRRSRKPDQK